MSQHDDFDRSLARWFEAEARPADTADVLDRALRATLGRRPRPRLFAALGSHWVSDSVGPTPGGATLAALLAGRARAAWLVVAALLALGMLAAIIAGQRAPEPGLGWMAFSRDGDVFLADSTGSGAILAIDEAQAFEVLGWSPDGRWLAVEAGRALYLLDPLTLELERLPAELTWSSFGGWSPDSSSIVYEVFDDAGLGSQSIWVVDRRTGANRELPGGRGVCLPVFSPDGRSVAAVARRGLVIIDLATGQRDVVEGAIGDGCQWTPAKDAPTWSPDSQRLAFVSGDEEGGPRTIVIVQRDGTVTAQIPGVDADRPLLFSPDGAWIAFPRQSGGLAMVRPDGRDLRVLVPDGVDRRWIRWSPDGSRVDFGRPAAGDGRCGCELWSVDVATGTVERLEAAGTSFDTFARRPALADGAEPLPKGLASEAPATITPLPAGTSGQPVDPTTVATGLAYDTGLERGDDGLLPCEAVVFWFAERSSTSQPASCGGPGWSPDASAHAHLAQPALGTLRVIGRDGSTIGELTLEGEIDPSRSKWSPAGRWLAIRMAYQEQYVLATLDGRLVATLPGEPFWSPNEERLAVASADGMLLVGSGDGSDLERTSTPSGAVTWSPDAHRFAYLQDGDVWIAEADGSGARNLTAFGVAAGATAATWSPDGASIAIAHGDVLWLIGPDGDERRRVEFKGHDLRAVSWSPDGRHVTVGWVGTHEGREGVFAVAGVAVADLRTAVFFDVAHEAWSQDGSLLALQPEGSHLRSPFGGEVTTIVIVRPDGSGRIDLELDRPIWSDHPFARTLRWVP